MIHKGKQSDKIRSSIVEILKENNPKEVQQKKLINYLLKKGFSIGSIRGVLYQHENNTSNQINNVYTRRDGGFVYYSFFENEFKLLEREVSYFLQSVSNKNLLSLDISTMSVNDKTKYFEYSELITKLRVLRSRK